MENGTELNENAKLEFTWYDYGLFLLMLLLSALIGVYFGFIKKQVTAKDYLLGGRDMSVFPVAMSLISSAISGISLLAVPADIYRYGVAYWFGGPMNIISVIVAYYVCIPVFYDLKVTSTYEYLERRFNVKVRLLTSALFTLTMFVYLPIVIYIPALALSQATTLNIHTITPVICGVCVFYTTFGGLKAVVWTDALQFTVMVGTIVVVLFLGVSSAGGFAEIWQKSADYRRLDIDFSFDATKRDTFWTGTIGTFTIWFSYVASNQGFIQKCIALPNYKAVRNAVIIYTLGILCIICSTTLCGLIMFTKYFDCDPLTEGRISEPDQLLPYYIMDIGKVIPGLAGLFTAGIFSAGLSTLSAVINCLSAIMYEDFISHFVKEGTSEKSISNYLKILSVVIGIISTGLVFFVPYMGSLLPLSVSVGGITTGAMIGIFLSGMLFPSINSNGVLWGGITATVTMVWIVFGSQYYKMTGKISYPNLPLMTHGCQNSSLANFTVTEEPYTKSPEAEPYALYKISFYYYTAMGMVIVIIVGLLVSKLSPKHNKLVGKEYFSPVIRHRIKEDDLPPSYAYLENQNKLTITIKDEL